MQIDVDNIQNHLRKKKIFEDDSNRIIGTEIRLNRKKLSLTLKAVADDTCSISYVSKVETNTIEANDEYLEEICSKVNIDKYRFEELKKSLSTCYEVIDAVYKKDKDTIVRIYDSCKYFENYRHLIIQLYYYFQEEDYNSFDKIYRQIIPLLSILSDIDLIMFVYIVACYAYEKGNTIEALRILKELDDLNISNNHMLVLIYSQYLKCLTKLNSNYFYIIKAKLIEAAGNESSTNYIAEAYELSKEFNIRNELIINMSEMSYDLTNPESEIYKLLLEKSKSNLMYKILFSYYINVNEFDELTNNFKSKYLIEEYLVDYLKLKRNNDDSAETYLLNICLPEAYRTGDMIYIIYFKYEIENYYLSLNRYKRYCEIENYYRSYLKELKISY